MRPPRTPMEISPMPPATLKMEATIPRPRIARTVVKRRMPKLIQVLMQLMKPVP